MDDKMPDMTGTSRGGSVSSSCDFFQSANSSSVKAGLSKHCSENVEYGQYSTKLTSDEIEDAELQKAIALSLQHDAGSGKNNTEISADLEKMLGQSMVEIKRKPCHVGASGDCPKKDVIDPHNYLRLGKDWPTGLKNVGNSCWFNVVVQSLFHLPCFRYIILQFNETDVTSASAETRRNLHVVQELRCLFSLMLASKKSYVDPQKCVRVLQDVFSNTSTNSQQDVSEFIHMLLDILEDVFQHKHTMLKTVKRDDDDDCIDPASGVFGTDSGIPRSGDSMHFSCREQVGNPMLDLFYGSSVNVDANSGTVDAFAEKLKNLRNKYVVSLLRHAQPSSKDHSNLILTILSRQSVSQDSTFGILPLCVEGCRNLHESLEHATARGHVGDSSREVWFTKLPPVLTFQLSRFNFNQNLRKPEKVHDRLAFPSVLYMDRYMESNMEVSREKREEVKLLSLQLHDLRLRLSRVLTICHSGTSYSLSKVLACCAGYASQKHGEESDDGESAAPAVRSSRRRSRRCSAESGISPHKKSKSAIDASAAEPRLVSLDDLDEKTEALIVERALCKWKDVIDEQIHDMKNKITSVERTIDSMYEESYLRQHRYTLHAVLVHQGQALAGHYWAYIYDYEKKTWLRFNDTSVTESTFEELANDSIGGTSRFCENYASAYCLIYVDSNRRDLFIGRDYMNVIASDPVLANLLNKHNEEINHELEEWNVEKAKQMSLETASTPSPAKENKASSDQADNNEDDKTLNLATLKKAIDRVASTYEGLGPAKALEKPDECAETSGDGRESSGDRSPERATHTHTGLADSVALTGGEPSDQLLLSRRVVSSCFSDDEDETILCPLFQACLFAIMKVGKTYNLDGPEAALDQAVDDELKRLRLLSEEESTLTFDPRLQNIVVYLYQNHAPLHVVERCVLEQFTDKRLKRDRRSADIMKCALDKMASLCKDDGKEDEITIWKSQYRSFCAATCHLLHGLELFYARKYFEAVLHFFAVHDCNKPLVHNGDSRKEVDVKLVRRYSRTCVKRISDEAMAALQSKDRDTAQSAVEAMRTRLMPCISVLLNTCKGGGTEQDIQLADTIRNDWCSLLEEHLVLSRTELSDVLTEFLDVGPSSTISVPKPVVKRPADLCQFYEQVMLSPLKEND